MWGRRGSCVWRFYIDKEIFDLSEYSKDLKFYKTSTKKLIKKMKDETKCVPVL